MASSSMWLMPSLNLKTKKREKIRTKRKGRENWWWGNLFSSTSKNSLYKKRKNKRGMGGGEGEIFFPIALSGVFPRVRGTREGISRSGKYVTSWKIVF